MLIKEDETDVFKLTELKYQFELQNLPLERHKDKKTGKRDKRKRRKKENLKEEQESWN